LTVPGEVFKDELFHSGQIKEKEKSPLRQGPRERSTIYSIKKVVVDKGNLPLRKGCQAPRKGR